MLNDPEHIDKYRFFVLVTQCPDGNRSWFQRHGDPPSGSDKGDEVLTITHEILQKTMREQPVDPDRVYVAGLSAGGSGVWEMATRYPELFAAVVPMASGGGDLSRVAKLVDLPICVFHNVGDEATPPKGDQVTVAALEAAGGNVHLTLYPVGGHDAWSAPMRDSIMDWILDQRRGVCWRPPNYDSWQWRHILTIPCGLLVFIRLGWSLEQWRRRKALRNGHYIVRK